MAHENLETRHYDNDDHNGNNRGHYDEYHHHNDNKDSFPNHDGNLEDHENEGFSPSFHGQADAKSYRFNNDYSPHSGGDFHGRPNKGGFHNSPGGRGFQNERGGGGFHNRPTDGDFHSAPNEGELHNAPPDEVHNVSPHEMYHDDRNHGDEMSHGGDYYHNRPSLKDYNNEKESKPFNDDFHEHDFQERSGLKESDEQDETHSYGDDSNGYGKTRQDERYYPDRNNHEHFDGDRDDGERRDSAHESPEGADQGKIDFGDVNHPSGSFALKGAARLENGGFGSFGSHFKDDCANKKDCLENHGKLYNFFLVHCYQFKCLQI